MSTWIVVAAAVGAGVTAGVFLAFSGFVITALRRLPAAHGVAAMQAINVVVVRSVFMPVLFGTGALALVAAVPALRGGAGTVWVLVGCAVYLVGTVLVTGLGNVPLNDALARVDPARDPGWAAAMWDRYASRWMFWNHVRTLASIAACACFVVALVRA